MSLTHQILQVVAYLSSLAVHEGLLKGYASIPGETLIQVAVLIDGKILDTIISGSPVPEYYEKILDEPAKKGSYSFALPLPDQIFNGSPHDLIARLYKIHQKPDKAYTKNAENSWLAESHLKFQHGDRHGQIAISGQYVHGWVTFNHRPKPLPQLTLSDKQGELYKQITLIPLPTEHEKPDKFQANFRFLLKDAPNPLYANCDGIKLDGSPCQPAQKLIGYLEKFNTNAICGWAFDANQPANPVELTLKIDHHIIQNFRPNLSRPDIANHLKMAQTELGIVGFQLTPPKILFDGKDHVLSVEFTDQKLLLKGSEQIVRIARNYQSFEETFGTALKQNRYIKPIGRPSNPVVSIIILNRNGMEPLTALFNSWKKQNSLTNIEIIIVDHASNDGSLELLNYWKTQLPLHVIALSFNDSFSASCNRAAAQARGQFLLFMNNDIVWLQDVLPAMVDILKNDPTIGILGLKLLKLTDNNEQAAIKQFEQLPVQHLGVRFKLSGVAYWPYEATSDENESAYDPQPVPAVTAAVMLCRREDFFRAGQFSPDYFYGFEDVEFCLRLSHCLNKKIICRNDLVALHHHGHTRLSGRASDIINRVIDNADILQKHIGLWLKRFYWSSLINAEQHLSTDKFTIGLVIDESTADHEMSRLKTDACKLAKQIMQCYPSVQIVFLPPSLGWYNLRDIHLLVVGHPEYDIGKTTCRREDLLIFAWIRNQAKLWASMPWWQHFDGYLAARADFAKQLAQSISSPIMQTTAKQPLGSLFNPQSPPLRIALLIPHKISTKYKACIDTLQQNLKTAGAVVWQDPVEAPDGSTRVADARIFICLNKKLSKITPEIQPHTLNIIWAPHISSISASNPPEGWHITNQMPEVDWLHNKIGSSFGNTFCSS